MKEKPALIKDSTIFVGLDLGDKTSETCILDEEGEMVEESRIPTTPAGLRRRFVLLSHCRVAMEVGTHSGWAGQLLNEMGHKVLVANARKLRLIYDNASKGDRADAQYLARLGHVDPKLPSPVQCKDSKGKARAYYGSGENRELIALPLLEIIISQ